MLKPTLARHFEEYAAFHRHPMNRLTHKIAIPLIVFHIVAMLDWVRFAQVGEVAGTPVYASLAWPTLVLVVGWYFTLHARLAIVMLLFYGVCIPIGWFVPWQAVVAIAVAAWLIQLAGHSVWEKNRPAFLKNMLQALIGPFFFAAILLGEWPPKPAAATAKA